MFIRLLLACVLFAFVASAQGQEVTPGSIQGLIVDAENGDAMIGVTVMLEGTSQGAATDLDGNFVIRNVAPGSYTVIANYIGYAKLTVTDVAVASGKASTLNLKLSPEALQAEEVVIEARRIDNTEASLLQIQRKAATVSNGVSAEQIKRSPDSDAADAVKRVTGITVVGDKYVFVRGMEERYNNTRLNGASLASPEPLKRVVPFDIIPAGLLNNIVVSKTFTPDLPGDFSGGSVQLTTKEFPDKLTLSISQSVSLNENTTSKGFQTYKGSNTDWIGYDDGERKLPSEYDNSSLTPRERALLFSDVWEGQATVAPASGSRSIAFGNQTSLGGRPFGFLATVTQSNSFSTKTEKYQEYSYSTLEDGTIFAEPTQNYVTNIYSKSGAVGGILDLNCKPSPSHKFSVKSMYTRSGDDAVSEYTGRRTDGDYVRGQRLTWTERSLATIQPKGEHQLAALRNSRVEWGLSISKGSYDQPDRRDFYQFSRDPDLEPFQYNFNNDNGIRRYAKSRDNMLEGSLDWTMPLKSAEDQSKIKFGGMFRTLDRDFPTRKITFLNADTLGAADLDRTLPANVLFNEDNIGAHWIANELSVNLDSYTADMKVGAGYLMADMLLTKKWRAIFGARVESTDQFFKTEAFPGSTDSSYAEGGPSHTDLLPSLNLTYFVGEKTNLRFAATRTIANPDYLELVPTEDRDYNSGTVKVGNPDLDYSKILNIDLRAELYPSIGEAASVGLFYKQIQDPIEWVYTTESISGGNQVVRKPFNLGDATLLGVELEFRKSLEFAMDKVGEWTRFFSVQGNLTLVSSSVDLKARIYDPANPTQTGLTSKDRPLMGQSEYVVNTTLAFDQPLWGTSIRLLYNTFGKRISELGANGRSDTYEQPFDRIDLVLNQNLGGHWSTKIQAKNLLDSTVEYTLDDQPLKSHKLGRTYSAGVTYSL
ncbi:MAG: outer membrane beta-barrel protein [Calditrichaeota bacterium]|nr:outer membrane beta-barrel protein [Calditrichota bacterium]MCB9369915.1 outer membrane beta-barrel protein [Calditrichota bacterium]